MMIMDMDMDQGWDKMDLKIRKPKSELIFKIRNLCKPENFWNPKTDKFHP
jgi:hypothetical protein